MELRTKREEELQGLKRALEESEQEHNSVVQEMRAKYAKQQDLLNEQLEQHKKQVPLGYCSSLRLL